jgi:hypothetical protein
MARRLSPDQSRKINRLSAGRSSGEGQAEEPTFLDRSLAIADGLELPAREEIRNMRDALRRQAR